MTSENLLCSLVLVIGLGARKAGIIRRGEDGQNIQLISELGGSALNHAWSSDDSLIAYQSNVQNGVFDIYVYELATGLTRLVTENVESYADIQDVSPTWYCNSTTLVFTSEAAGDNNIYTVEALPIDAPAIKVDEAANQLTSDPGNDRDPQNSPLEENASRGGSLPPKFVG